MALRAAYGCEGTSTRHYNEPAGNQDVWHIHIHVFPLDINTTACTGAQATGRRQKRWPREPNT